MSLRKVLIALLAIPFVAGCVKEPAGFNIDGGKHSLTIERNKPYLWSDGWEIDLIVARYPECQRRYPLMKSGERVRIDLYQSQPQVFILNQGKRWYVAETMSCRMEQFEQEPPEPGQLLGVFRVKGGEFGFVPAADTQE